MNTNSTARKAADRGLLLFFLAIIALPLMGLMLPREEVDHREQRTRAKLPALPGLHRAELRRFPHEFEQFFNDHFVGRDTLIHWYKLAQFQVLGTSQAEIAVKASRAISDDKTRDTFASVLRGKDDWLFFAGERALENYIGKNSFSAGELDAWCRVFQQRHDWLAQRGIAYAVIVAPNKHSIYPEQIPDYVKIVNPKRRFHKLQAALQANTNVRLIDVHNAVRAGKARELTYDRTGTHWNQWGAFLAYQEIGSRLGTRFPAMRPQSLDQFDFEVNEATGRELAVMLGLENLVTERQVLLRPRQPRLAKGDSNDPWAGNQQYVTKHPDQSLPRIVVFHDSFMLALQPYLSEHCSEARYYWNRWEKLSSVTEMIEQFRPHLVIEEIVERHLESPPPVNPPELLPTVSRLAEQPGESRWR